MLPSCGRCALQISRSDSNPSDKAICRASVRTARCCTIADACPAPRRCPTWRFCRWPVMSSRPFGDSIYTHKLSTHLTLPNDPLAAWPTEIRLSFLRRDARQCRKMRQLFLRKNQARVLTLFAGMASLLSIWPGRCTSRC